MILKMIQMIMNMAIENMTLVSTTREESTAVTTALMTMEEHIVGEMIRMH